MILIAGLLELARDLFRALYIAFLHLCLRLLNLSKQRIDTPPIVLHLRAFRRLPA